MFEIIKIMIASILFIINLFKFNKWTLFIAYTIISYPLFISFIKNIRNKKIFDENLLMIIATIGAIVIGEYSEALSVVILYQIGELLNDISSDKSKKDIVSLLDLKNIKVHLKDKDIDAKDLKVGDTIYIKAFEKIPVDCILKSDSVNLDLKSLTGESKSKRFLKGDLIYSGSINLDGFIEAEVVKTLDESTSTKIMNMIKDSVSIKSNHEKFITKFASIYTPCVIIFSILMVILAYIFKQNLNIWVYRALVFLVISCPCALVISVPLSYFSAIGKCSRIGILVKGSEYIEKLVDIDTVVLDKTGTITEGNFEVSRVIPYNIEKGKLIYYAAYAEVNSNHPIANIIKKQYKNIIDIKKIEDFKEIPGRGIEAIIDGKKVLIGNYALLDENNITYPKVEFLGTTVLVAVNNKYIGTIVISDSLKENCEYIALSLRKVGFKKTVLLSGDDKEIVSKLALKLKFDESYGGMLPNEKLEILKELNKEGKTIFVGDGINDSLVLLESDIGISMGGIGSDAAIETSDIVILDDDPYKIIDAYHIAKKTRKIVKFNIYMAIIIKITCLLLGFIGIANMWLAVLSDVGVTLIAILNSLRIYKSEI